MRPFLAVFVVLLFLVFLPGESYSQPGGGGPNGAPAVPITGLEYLLIGGGAYGVSRLLKHRRKKNNQS